MSDKQATLVNYYCGSKSMTNEKLICKRLVQEYDIDDLWTIQQYKNSGILFQFLRLNKNYIISRYFPPPPTA